MLGMKAKYSLESAHKKFVEYQGQGFPIYVAQAEGGEQAGYLVCRGIIRSRVRN